MSVTRGDDVRSRLLGAALEELSRSGVVNTSLRAIARRVGVTHQAISHYFTSRSALLAQLAVEGFGDLGASMTARLDGVPDEAPPAERVAAVGAAYLAFAEDRPALFDLMYGSGTTLLEDDAAVGAAKAAVWERFVVVVERSRAEGWGTDSDVVDLATASWALLHGAVTLRAQGLRHGLLGAEPEEIARRATQLVRG